jgi:multidrug efflux pump subunit AcrB
MIAIFGFIALNGIPKESTPQLNLPLISINTVYE